VLFLKDDLWQLVKNVAKPPMPILKPKPF